MKLSQIPNISNSKEFEFKNPETNESFEPKVIISIFYHESKHGLLSLQNAMRESLELMQDEANLKEDGTLKSEIAEKINLKHLASLVDGWSGIEDNDNNPLEFSKENAIEIMKNEIIFKFVVEKASSMGNFTRE